MEDMTEIAPTGTCFDDAAELLNEWAAEYPEKDWFSIARLAHGIWRDSSGEPYAHAWVELNGNEIWSEGYVNGERVRFSVPKDEFYSEMKPEDVTLYSLVEVVTLNRKHGTSGPWESKYLRLTGNNSETVT